MLLKNFIRFNNHTALLFEVDGFKEKEPVCDSLGIAASNLPEPLDREAFGIDENNRSACPQAGDGGNCAERTFAACRATVNLGEGAEFEPAAEQAVEGRVAAAAPVGLHRSPGRSRG